MISGRSGFFALLLCVAVPACAQTPATYYVDFDNGRDTNDGRSPASPWKHAPGDPQATGGPAGKKLTPGDKVRFKGGVRYRGSIRMHASGTDGAPISYIGMGWGEGRAIIDGADPVLSAEQCPSMEACGNAPNWQQLLRVEFRKPPTKFVKFYDTTGLLFRSQYPQPADPFNNDDRREYLKTPASAAGRLKEGVLEHAELARLAEGGGPYQSLVIWHKPNLITHRRIQSISGDTLRFNGKGLIPYTDRQGAVALVGSARLLTHPGTYALIGDTTAVVYPRPDGGELAVGNGRSAFDTHGQSHIVISGFQVAHGTAGGGENGNGLAIFNSRYNPTEGLVIEHNVFGPASLVSGRGIVAPSHVDDVLIRNNHFDAIEYGSGIRAVPNVSNIRVINNQLSRFGRTGLYMGAVKNGEVRGNVISDVKAIHGNGMSFYLENQNILIDGNCVYDTVRPITFHGSKRAKRPATRNNLTIQNNIFLTSPKSQAAITSWGAEAGGIHIENNVAFGTKLGMLLHENDTDVTVIGNRSNKISTRSSIPSEWVVKDNMVGGFSVGEIEVSPTYCRARGASGPLVINIHQPAS